MIKLDTNLDAYRMLAENLSRLRLLLRHVLNTALADTSADERIPGPVRAWLEQRRDRETSISWHASDSLDLLDYAGYSDLYDIMVSSPQILERFAGLAPDANVLRIRFLELHTIFNRVAYVRPVTENEMGFLVTFDERVRKLEAGDATQPSSAREPARPASPPPSRTEAARTPAPAQRTPSPPAPAPTPQATPAPAPAARTQPPAPQPVRKTAPPAREAEPPQPAAPTIRLEEQATPAELAKALDGDRDAVVLTALYREITTIADGLWSQAAPAPARVWEQVRESPWYRRRFAPLGLKPLSDFYALVDLAREQLLGGLSRSRLQDFLKERNFAQLLLSLREVFRQHLAA